MLDDDKVVGLLMRNGLLTPYNLNQAKRIQKKANSPLYHILLEHQIVDESRALQAISDHIQTPCVALSEFSGDLTLLSRVPRQVAEAYRVLPIGLMSEAGPERLFLAMADPTDLVAMEAISQATGLDVEPVLVGPMDLKQAIARCYDIPLDEVDLNKSVPHEPSGDLSGLEWDMVELDSESYAYLSELLKSDIAEPGDDDMPTDADGMHSSSGPGATGVAKSEGPLFAEPTASLSDVSQVKTNTFREFMTRSAVSILSPIESAMLQSPPSRQVGSKDLLEAVVRILIKRGIITEKEVLEELAETRKRRVRER